MSAKRSIRSLTRTSGAPTHAAGTQLASVHSRMLVEAKQGRRIAVCIPARNEETTVGGIVHATHRALRASVPLVDEIIVMDHASTDDTAAAGRAAGARVVSVNDVAGEFGAAVGKGDVLWRSLLVTDADIIAWIDADLTSFDPVHVVRLVGPLLLDERVSMVRGMHVRQLNGTASEGGRVTALTARPLLRLLHPELAHIQQPLGGEYAVRRRVAVQVPFEVDYGVEMGLLLDIARLTGAASIEQVDLGPLGHRNRPLAELHEQSVQIMRSLLCRQQPTAPLSPGPQRMAVADYRRSFVPTPNHAA